MTDNQATALHGSITGLLFNGTGIATYTNNGDGALTDSFILLDEASDEVHFAVTVLPPASNFSVLPASLPAPVISVPYSQTLTASGGVAPYTYTVAPGSLPAGLSLSSGGVLSGTATATGSFSVVVDVSDSTPGTALTDTKNYSVTVAIPTQSLSSSGTPPGGVLSTAYSHQFSTVGGTPPYIYQFHSGTPPPGLTLSSDGKLSGTPTTAGDYTFKVQSTDSTGGLGPYPQAFPVDLKINAGPPPIVGAVNATIVPGSSANPITLNISGGALSVAVSSAPSHGMTSASGTSIYYTPNVGYTGPDSFAYTATNANGTSNPAIVTLSVVGVPDAPTVGSVTAGDTTASVSFTPAANNGGTPVSSYTVISSPGGFTGSGAASPVTVTGLTNGATYNFTVTATNSQGTSGSSAPSNSVTPQAPAPVVSSISPARGPTAGGNSVVITGSGFNVVTSVKFGGTASTAFAVNSATQITAIAPAGSGTIDITVVTAGGTSATSGADQYTYVAAPTVSSISPSSGPSGTNVTLTGTGFTGATAVTFGATAASSFTVVSATQITATAPAGSGTVDVTVTTALGTSLTSSADQFTYEAITAGPVSSTVAYGSSANLITLPLGGAVTSVSFATGPVHGTAVINGNSISYTPTAGYAGPDSMTYTATNGVVTTAPATITLSVAPPTLATTPGGPWTATSGQAFSKVLTFSGGMAPYSGVSVTGLPPGLSSSASATGVTISGTPTQSGSFPVSVSMTDSSTGYGPYTQQNTFALTVDGAQALALSPAGTTFNAPQDSVFTYVFSVTGGIAPYTFTQTGSLPAGVSWNGASATLSGTPTASGAFPFSIQVTDSSSGTPISTAQNYTLQVANHSVAPTVTSISPNSGPAAGGTNVTINGTGFSPVLYVTFGGTRANFTVGSATQITATAPAGSGTVDVTVTTALGTSLTSTADQFTYDAITASPVSAVVGFGSTANSIALTLGGAVTSVSLATSPAHGTATVVGNSISYTPTAGYAGPDSMTYTATNGVVTTAPATITLSVAPPTLAITPLGPWTATNGQAFSKVLTFSGGMAPYSGVSVTGLPPGLSSSASATGVTVSGTPTQSGSFAVSVSMTDSSTGNGPFTQQNTFALTVDGAQALALSPGGTTFNATQDSVFTQVFSVTGGIAPYTFTQTGSLPAGVSWNGASATLSGTPTASGAFPFSIQVTDSSSGTPISTAQNYTLQVANLVPVAPPQSVASAGPGEPVEVNLTANATGGPFTAATVLTVAPASAGSATISVAGASAARRQLRAAPSNNYVLRFVPNPDASGVVTVAYSLTNANALTANGVVTISLTSRGDPSKDAEVQGLLNAQANSSRRFASGQISNFQQRLEALHAGNVSAFSNGFNLSSASLQRQRLRQNQNDDPTGIEQWMQIQSAKLNADQSLRTRTLGQQARELKPASAGAEGPELGNQSASAATSPLAFWTSGTISIGDDSSGSSAQSQEFVTSGLSVGADYRIASNLTVGLGFGYGHDKTDIGDNGSRSQADSYSVAVYGSYRPIQSIYLDAVLGYQRLSFDNRRYVTDNAGMVTGDRDGGQTFASLAAGYEFREESWLVSPYARLDLAHAKLDSYRERGDNLFALNYDQQTVKTTSTSLGVRGEFALSTAIGDLTPSLRLEYQHDFQGTGDASMRYADTGDGALYRISLDSLGQDRGVMGVGLGLLTAGQWSLNTEYQYTLSSGSQKAQTLLFSLRKPF